MSDDIAARLRVALVAAYRPYVQGVLADRRLPPVSDAITEGAEWLDRELGALLSLPPAQQPRSPLEIFQEALRFPTAAIEATGIEPVVRDEVAVSALPGDVYDLAPTSSQALGEEVWQTHLEWGAAKAAALQPVAVLVSRNLMDGSRVEAAAEARRYRLVTVRRLEALPDRAVVVFVDLEHPDADEAVRMATTRAGRVVAYGPHVDDLAITRAQSLGAAAAMPRSRFFKDIAGQFPTLA